MNNPVALFRALAVYAICIPLAIFLGFLATDPMTRRSFVGFGMLVMFLCLPILLRFHYHFMLVTWGTSAVIFFLPGRPQLWLLAVFLSLGISITHRILDRDFRFINVPQVIWPMLALALVVLVTAQLTGGIGFRALGGESYGGRKYIFVLTSIAAYFALTAARIPPEKAGLYLGLYFLGALTNFIGDLFAAVDPSLYFIFLLFPPNFLVEGGIEVGTTRLGGLAFASTAVFCFMMARYGIRGIFLSVKPLRLVVFIVLSFAGLYGGYRSTLITYIMVFAVQFFLEGLHRTRVLLVFVLLSVLTTAVVLPFTSRLPHTVQRTLAFLPIKLDPIARADADGSTEWRLRMWKAVLPQVPEYLLLGKGYGLSRSDLLYMQGPTATAAISEDQWGSALAGDYHNGPLSVLIPFGIWGMLAFIWLLAAGCRVLYRNYKHGDPSLRTINAFLLALFTTRIVFFFVIFGALNSDMMLFAGTLGLSISLNGGVASAPKRAEQADPVPSPPPPSFIPRVRPLPGR
jgi:hypothetical protein